MTATIEPVIKTCRICREPIQLVRRAHRDGGTDVLDASLASSNMRDGRRSRIVVGGHSWRLSDLIKTLLAEQNHIRTHQSAEHYVRGDAIFAWHAVHQCPTTITGRAA